MRRSLLLAVLTSLSACSAGSIEEPANPVPVSEPPDCARELAGNHGLFETSIFADADRAVPMTVLHPEAPGEYPLIAFSHGAFAAPDRYLKMLGPLAAAGNIVIAPMHIDSEEFGRSEPASPGEVWRTRNEDMKLALSELGGIDESLAQNGLSIDRTKVIAMGHSYGALMAQLAGGAQAIEDDGSTPDRRDPAVDAVVAWSPPGVLPGRMTQESWSTLAAPSLTITGTADVLPGFIDNWEDHTASYDNAPAGSAELWVGEGVNHYFGGMFGREKPADAASRALFARALSQTLGFMQRAMEMPQACSVGETAEGETYQTR